MSDMKKSRTLTSSKRMTNLALNVAVYILFSPFKWIISNCFWLKTLETFSLYGILLFATHLLFLHLN